MIAPERLLRALLLQTFYTIRSEYQLMEQLDYNLLLRWFVGLSMDAPVWDAPVYSKNRDRRLSLGNPGGVRTVGGGVSDGRIDHGSGYRAYFHPVDRETVVLLVGGNKRTQLQDIARARDLARELAKGENP